MIKKRLKKLEKFGHLLSQNYLMKEKVMAKKKFELSADIVKNNIENEVEAKEEQSLKKIAQVTIYIEDDFKCRLKAWCAKNRIHMKDFIQEALEIHLQKKQNDFM